MKKVGLVLDKIVAVAFALCLFLGGLGFLGYVVAFCAGGDIAAQICVWLSDYYYTYLIKLATISTLVTFLSIYLKGDANWVNPFKKVE